MNIFYTEQKFDENNLVYYDLFNIQMNFTQDTLSVSLYDVINGTAFQGNFNFDVQKFSFYPSENSNAAQIAAAFPSIPPGTGMFGYILGRRFHSVATI